MRAATTASTSHPQEAAPPPAGATSPAAGAEGRPGQAGRGSAWWAFWTGLQQSLRHWPLLAPFYLVLAAISLLLLTPLGPGLTDRFGFRLAAWEVAEGIPSWLVGQVIRELPAQAEAMRAGIRPLVLFLPASPLLLSLPFAILAGGALTVYAEGSRGRFWPGLARHAGAFALLQLLEVAMLEGATLIGLFLTGLGLAVLAAPGGPQATGWGSIVLLLVGLLLLALLLLTVLYLLVPWWFEYARALAVLQGQRRPGRLLGASARFLRHNLGPATGLALFSFLWLLVPYVAFIPLSALLPATWWPAHMALQQFLILAIVAARLARLASQMCLVQARSPLALAPASSDARAHALPGQGQAGPTVESPGR